MRFRAGAITQENSTIYHRKFGEKIRCGMLASLYLSLLYKARYLRLPVNDG
jgi:hypothetical protein